MPTIFGSDKRDSVDVILDITGSSSSSGVFASLLNPFGVDCMIVGAKLNITTQSTGAATCDIGTAATAISNDGLIDGLSVAATGLFSNFLAATAGTNGKPAKLWPATSYLTVAEATGDVDGLVARLYVSVIPL